ncbi:MAG: DnaB-like helicase N-terminal domain-containing protein, partial [Myxococcota bacterium]|nr:DnaB-like helicase N-terminal domain-containing protein [Myxococcota bacterium]
MDRNFLDPPGGGQTTGGSSPHNVEAERRVLGAFLKDPSLVSTHGEELDESDFHHEPHRHLFSAMKTVTEDGQVIDVVTVGEQLAKDRMLDAIGGPPFLGKLLEDTATTIGVEHHLKIVRE